MAEIDLSELRAAYAATTPGDWKLWGMSVLSSQDGTSNVETAVPVAHTQYRDEHGKPRTFDADFIATMHRVLPALLDEIEAGRNLRERVEALAAEWEADDQTSLDRFGQHQYATVFQLAGMLRDAIAEATS